jgi:cyclic lactone autoinducer peptide
MKHNNGFAAKAVKAAALYALKRDANSTTCLAVYQPKVPASLNKFKKVKDVH